MIGHAICHLGHSFTEKALFIPPWVVAVSVFPQIGNVNEILAADPTFDAAVTEGHFDSARWVSDTASSASPHERASARFSALRATFWQNRASRRSLAAR